MIFLRERLLILEGGCLKVKSAPVSEQSEILTAEIAHMAQQIQQISPASPSPGRSDQRGTNCEAGLCSSHLAVGAISFVEDVLYFSIANAHSDGIYRRHVCLLPLFFRNEKCPSSGKSFLIEEKL